MEEWSNPIGEYGGSYPTLREQFHEWFRVIGKYNGRYRSSDSWIEDYIVGVRERFPLVQPVNLASNSNSSPSVQFEESPHQRYRAEIYYPVGNTTELAFADDSPLHCPLLPGELESLSMHASEFSRVSNQQSAPRQESALEIDRTMVDFDGDGQYSLVVLSWLGEEGVDLEAPGLIRIYSDADEDLLVYERHTTVGVLPAGAGFSTVLDRSGSQILQVNWYTGAHGIRSYFIRETPQGFSHVPTVTREGDIVDSVVSDGGAVTAFDDGALSVIDRGAQSFEQTDVTIHTLMDGRFEQVRRYRVDSAVEDETTPITEARISPEPNANDWVSFPAAVLLSATDDNAVHSIEYRLKNSETTSSRSSRLKDVELSIDEGRWVIEYRAVDVYGNFEGWNERTMLVDGTAPLVEAKLSGSEGVNGWFTSPVEVEIHAEDPDLNDGSAGSGIDFIQYRLADTTEWKDYAQPFEIDTEGTNTVEFRAIDLAGNASDVANEVILIDTLAPEITASVTPEELWPPNGKAVVVEFSGLVEDRGSGLNTVQLGVEDEYGTWEPDFKSTSLSGEPSFVVEEEFELIASRRGQDTNGRVYLVRLVATDVAGNTHMMELVVLVPHDQRERRQ